MAKTMLGAFLPGNSTVEMREIAIPEPGIGQVLLKIKASGICGSDIHYIYHEHKGDKAKGTAYLDVVAGHEPCGQVVSTGPGTQWFKEGDRVIVYHISGCGFCRNCRKGFQISCLSDQRQAYGWQRNGGHAEYLLADEKDLIALPDKLSYADGSFVSCGVGTAYEGVLRADICGSDTVLIVGLGPVGLAAAMLARGKGARMVIGVDVQAARRKESTRLGLVDCVLDGGEETLAHIRELTNGGATRSLDCSGHHAGRLLALQGAAEWGRTVYLGETGHVQFQVSDDLMHKQRTLIGSWVTSLANMEQCCDDLVAWGQHPDKIVTNYFALEDTPKAYELMASGKSGKVIVEPDGSQQ
ncbi:putative oxidoreductase, Zn-dependent and NAD(P)-binding [Vibrio nigripulchritudo SOn1]|uniref:Oxidoreductase, Zn-dependent and NAD(P)-binding n=1 Tax=Vibrio nigripulchritudo SOn1 TaxID=1238450 RepID=A0AAV2W1P3_9VIBR|nr:zinc-binding dehydrogenase [Vibrio nigripulchritudo]CCO50347.1 putative oxidoreductase, Zn-dependent and NAD(P)-binding [Vibrio nigripulchritudo SOn1]